MPPGKSNQKHLGTFSIFARKSSSTPSHRRQPSTISGLSPYPPSSQTANTTFRNSMTSTILTESSISITILSPKPVSQACVTAWYWCTRSRRHFHGFAHALRLSRWQEARHADIRAHLPQGSQPGPVGSISIRFFGCNTHRFVGLRRKGRSVQEIRSCLRIMQLDCWIQ